MKDFPLFALLTDFGTRDGYVGSLKAAIYKVQPRAQIIDISHDVAPQDISQGAFLLRLAFEDYPPETIFIAVVDPGVGSARHALLVEAGGRFLLGPDNGLFSYIYDLHPGFVARKLENRRTFAPQVSSTFHGRDIFAPCAAALSTGVAPDDFGPLLEKPPLRCPSARVSINEHSIHGNLVYVDVFGNLISNIHLTHLKDGSAIQSVVVNDIQIPLHRTYAEAKNNLMAVWGSSGFLEISWPGGSAVREGRLRVSAGVTVSLSIFPGPGS